MQHDKTKMNSLIAFNTLLYIFEHNISCTVTFKAKNFKFDACKNLGFNKAQCTVVYAKVLTLFIGFKSFKFFWPLKLFKCCFLLLILDREST